MPPPKEAITMQRGMSEHLRREVAAGNRRRAREHSRDFTCGIQDGESPRARGTSASERIAGPESRRACPRG